MPKLAEFDRCTGCTACAAVCPMDCIAMEPDADGFFHPTVDKDTCVSCSLCEQVCPILYPIVPNHTPTIWAAKSRDEVSRKKSTSGGVFTELAKAVLAKGGAVYGAAYDETFRVVHIYAETEGELDRLRGAKYAQSSLDGVFTDVKLRLDAGQQVLFSGTPCQVLGLKAYLRKDYANLFTVDLVCHSVPSPMAWEKYLEYISGEQVLTAVNLRCKDTGWSRYRYSNRFEFADGSSRMDSSDQSLYMKLFGGGYISRSSCENCPAKGYARVSDLTLGDFWGIWDIRPELDDDRGVSLVLAQTQKGLAALEALEKWPFTLEEASRENSAIFCAVAPNPMRKQAMELIREGDFKEASRLICAVPQEKYSFLHRVRRFLKQWLLGS